MTIYKIMLTMWVYFWVVADFLFTVYILPFVGVENKNRAGLDLFATLFSSFLGIILSSIVLGVKKDIEPKIYTDYSVLILGFLYFFGKNIMNLVLNWNILKTTTTYFFLVPFIQFGWFFPSIMFFVANTYFAFKYCNIKFWSKSTKT
jgi:hypothetical protein